MSSASMPAPFTIREKADQWEVVLHFDGGTDCALCATKEDAEAVADSGPLVSLYRTGQRCEGERVQRCREALARSGYELETSFLARQLLHYGQHLECGTIWAAGDERDTLPS